MEAYGRSRPYGKTKSNLLTPIAHGRALDLHTERLVNGKADQLRCNSLPQKKNNCCSHVVIFLLYEAREEDPWQKLSTRLPTIQPKTCFDETLRYAALSAAISPITSNQNTSFNRTF